MARGRARKRRYAERSTQEDIGPEQPTAPSNRRVREGDDLGPCGLCGRALIAGPSIDRHHLIPRSEGGTEAVWMHVVCHRKIHSVFPEKRLASDFNTFERLLEDTEIVRFVAWIQKKDPQYYTRHRRPNRRD